MKTKICSKCHKEKGLCKFGKRLASIDDVYWVSNKITDSLSINIKKENK